MLKFITQLIFNGANLMKITHKEHYLLSAAITMLLCTGVTIVSTNLPKQLDVVVAAKVTPKARQALQESIKKAQAYTAKYYTPASYAKLQSSLVNAKKINRNSRSSAYQITVGTQNLNYAMQKIVKLPVVRPKITPKLPPKLPVVPVQQPTRQELTTLIKKAFQITQFPGTYKEARDKFGRWYTQSSVTKLANVMPQVMQIYTNHESSPGELIQAYTSLKQALNQLVLVQGPLRLSQLPPLTTTTNALKADFTGIKIGPVMGQNGAVQAGTINLHPVVEVMIKGKNYNLTTDMVRTLKLLTPGKYTLTYHITGGNGMQAVSATNTRVLTIVADNKSTTGKPTYHFQAPSKQILARNVNMYSTLPYAQLNNTPILYDNVGNVVDPQAYKIEYQILVGRQAIGLFERAIAYQLPGTYRMQYTAIARGTNRILAQLNQALVVNNPTNQHLIKVGQKYTFTGLKPATISAADFNGISKAGDTGDISFDPYYQVGLKTITGQMVTNYDTVMIYSNWADLYYGPGQLSKPGQYTLRYVAMAANGQIVAQANRVVTIVP